MDDVALYRDNYQSDWRFPVDASLFIGPPTTDLAQEGVLFRCALRRCRSYELRTNDGILPDMLWQSGDRLLPQLQSRRRLYSLTVVPKSATPPHGLVAVLAGQRISGSWDIHRRRRLEGKELDTGCISSPQRQGHVVEEPPSTYIPSSCAQSPNCQMSYLGLFPPLPSTGISLERRTVAFGPSIHGYGTFPYP